MVRRIQLLVLGILDLKENGKEGGPTLVGIFGGIKHLCKLDGVSDPVDSVLVDLNFIRNPGLSFQVLLPFHFPQASKCPKISQAIPAKSTVSKKVTFPGFWFHEVGFTGK